MSISDKGTTKNSIKNELKNNFSLDNSALAKVSLPKDEHSSTRESSYNQNYELDVLSQFKTNLNQVENLSRRLKFVLGEVGQLMKKY